jgi:anti-sigma regulatory factor (Ser/Thr protein kinase)
MPSTTISFAVAATPLAARRARHRIMSAVRSWGVPLDEDLAYRIELVAAELLTNGLLHAGGWLRAGADLDIDRLIIEVFDGDTTVPRLRDAGPDSESGRGLALIDSLCPSSGAEISAGGKRCWAVLSVPAPPRLDPHLNRGRPQATRA